MISFNDEQKGIFFNKNGYVVLSIFSNEEIKQLYSLYLEFIGKYNTHKDQSLYNIFDKQEDETVLKYDLIIKSIVSKKLEKHLSNFDYLFSNFLIKPTGQKNATPFHQDPTLVENDSDVSVNVWIPLQNTFKENGCLKMVPGSHIITNQIVAVPSFPTYYKSFENKLNYYTVDVPLKLGEVVLFNNKLIHGAHSNLSNQDRIAAVVAIKSKDANWSYFYYQNEILEKYHIEKAGYLSVVKDSVYRPNPFISKEVIKYEFNQLNYPSFMKRMFCNLPFFTFKSVIKSIFK